MNANDNDPKPPAHPPRELPEPQLPNPPEPRKSMEIRASDTNMPEPPPTLSSADDSDCDEV